VAERDVNQDKLQEGAPLADGDDDIPEVGPAIPPPPKDETDDYEVLDDAPAPTPVTPVAPVDEEKPARPRKKKKKKKKGGWFSRGRSARRLRDDDDNQSRRTITVGRVIGTGLVAWGVAIVVYLLLNPPKGGGAYAAGQIIGGVFGVILFLVGLLVLYRG
jgi:hypothetical protein